MDLKGYIDIDFEKIASFFEEIVEEEYSSNGVYTPKINDPLIYLDQDQVEYITASGMGDYVFMRCNEGTELFFEGRRRSFADGTAHFKIRLNDHPRIIMHNLDGSVTTVYLYNIELITSDPDKPFEYPLTNGLRVMNSNGDPISYIRSVEYTVYKCETTEKTEPIKFEEIDLSDEFEEEE